MATMFSKYEGQITQLEAEQGITKLFDFIQDYQKNLSERLPPLTLSILSIEVVG
jgi:hypothetical protein